MIKNIYLTDKVMCAFNNMASSPKNVRIYLVKHKSILREAKADKYLVVDMAWNFSFVERNYVS